MDLVEKGSQTAKNGFRNEIEICEKFNNWQEDLEVQKWLKIMKYDLAEVEFVTARVLHGFKADLNIEIKLKNEIAVENIQVKLVSNKKGFNQVDKRWLSHYETMWNIPPEIFRLLQYFTGEIPPYKNSTKDKRRMFLNEFGDDEQHKILEWFNRNKSLILNDIIKGRGQYSAEWVLVAQKVNNNAKWILVNINEALCHYSSGDVLISPKGSLYIGRITMQRKGGDNGRDTANMLQFKLDPTSLFNINE